MVKVYLPMQRLLQLLLVGLCLTACFLSDTVSARGKGRNGKGKSKAVGQRKDAAELPALNTANGASTNASATAAASATKGTSLTLRPWSGYVGSGKSPFLARFLTTICKKQSRRTIETLKKETMTIT